MREIAVVGLVEVLGHLPRIWGCYQRLKRAIEKQRPDVAILTDSPDFHLRLASHLAAKKIPIIYFIAPQAWAWRKGRVNVLRRTVRKLLCIFPFEEEFFHRHQVPATYIGHPLSVLAKPTMFRDEFFARHNLPADLPVYSLLPGSRHGEVERHLPRLIDAVQLLSRSFKGTYVLALPPGFGLAASTFWEPIRRASIQVIEGFTWDVLAHSELALAASGTVTVEAALLGVPMVTFYRVNALSWILGRWLVDVPFLSMVNLVAGRQVVTELIQSDFTAQRLAAEAARLLESDKLRSTMRRDLAEVAARLSSSRNPLDTAASYVEQVLHTGVK
jgi:lipid-A-disaccharide synthase